jgi:hypothetical protein
VPFLSTALGIGAIASGVGGAAASLYGSSVQAGAAKTAAQLQAEEAANSLAFQKQVYGENVARAQPWVTAGTTAINELSDLTKTPGEGLLTPWTTTFQAPTGLTEQNDPGYQARLKLGQQALENSAAARGGVLGGGTAKDLTNYAQDFASNEYSNVYSRAQQEYQNAYNVFQNNQSNTYNRLAGVAGIGQTSTTALGNQGQAAAGNVANINLTSGQQIGNSLQNAAYQTASGYAGAANSFSGMMGGLSSLAMMQKLLNPLKGPGDYPPTPT